MRKDVFVMRFKYLMYCGYTRYHAVLCAMMLACDKATYDRLTMSMKRAGTWEKMFRFDYTDKAKFYTPSTY